MRNKQRNDGYNKKMITRKQKKGDKKWGKSMY